MCDTSFLKYAPTAQKEAIQDTVHGICEHDRNTWRSIKHTVSALTWYKNGQSVPFPSISGHG